MCSLFECLFKNTIHKHKKNKKPYKLKQNKPLDKGFSSFFLLKRKEDKPLLFRYRLNILV